jgi:HK97 family phage portal protein
MPVMDIIKASVNMAFSPRVPIVGGGSSAQSWAGGSGDGYPATVRAYNGNEIVSAAVNLLMSSASEPHIIGRRYRRNRPQIRTEMRHLNASGVYDIPGRWQRDSHMVRNGFWETLDAHPLVTLLNNPNPYQDRAEFYSQLVMDYYLAGNAYVIKARYRDGMLEGTVGELWRLRPDRIKPVPGDMSKGEPYLKGYEYTVDGQNKVLIPTDDILHFKTQDALNPYEGVSPIIAALERVDIDRAMRTFLRTFYQRGGASIGGSMNFKGKMDQAQKDDIRARLRRMFNGGQYDILISAAEDVQWHPFGLNRGLTDAAPRDIDAVNEARISMVLRIPPGILGLLIGLETSSYANQRASWAVLWDVTLVPFLSRLEAVLNRSLVPDFGNIDEVVFDLSDINALREDEDALQERARKNYAAGLTGFYETRLKIGAAPTPTPGELFPVPTTAVLTPVERLGEQPEPPAPPALPEPQVEARVGRPRIEDDPGARAIYDEAMSLNERYPHLTWAHIAARVSVSERTLREYRKRFEG